MVTKAKTAKGIKLGVYVNGPNQAPVFFEEVKASPAIGESPAKVDATSFDSNAHEYVKDIPDFSADLTFTMNAQPYISGGTAEASNLNLIQSLDKNAAYQWVVLYPALNQQVTILGDWSWNMGAGAVSQVMDVELTIIPRSAPIFTDYGVDSYTLSFNPVSDSGTGTGEMTSQVASAGTTIKAPACTFTAPEGKVFGSWNTEPDGTGVSYDLNDSILMDANYTLYAIWVTDNSTE